MLLVFGRASALQRIECMSLPPPRDQPTSLETYRRALRSCPHLSAAEERALTRRFHAGDRRAGARLVEANLPFVLLIAREYRRWGVPMEDIVQQGNLGLLKAAERFDPDRDCRLVTYAGYWIRAEIREYVVRMYRVVRLGTTKGERKALRAYRTTAETNPERLATVSGLDVRAVERLMPILAAREASLDEAPRGGLPLADRVAAEAPSPEEEASLREEHAHLRAEITALLSELGPRERRIVGDRFLAEEPVTLESLGARFGISKERVRQLESRALAKLKSRLEAIVGFAEAC
jgi:RNA polymerase sigma-32 factor